MKKDKSKYIIIISMLLFCLLILFLSTVPECKASPDVTLYVKTIDGKALPNAIVKIYNSTTQQLITEKTSDSNGKVSLPINGTKTYKLVVEYPRGFEVYVNSTFVYGELGKKEVKVNVLSEWVLTIYDKYGRDVLQNVDVKIIHGENDTIAFSLKTGSDGKVKFTYVPLGEGPSAKYLVNISYANKVFENSYECSENEKSVSVKLDLYRVVVRVSDVLNRPVEGIAAEIREDLDEKPISSGTSNSTGHAVLKLVPNGKYFLIAKLGEYTVYQSDEKVIEVYNNDKEFSITAQVVKLNITVYDYDGESIISHLDTELIGQIRDVENNKLVSETSTLNGELKFNYVPLGKFKLTVTVAGIVVYSQDYEVTPQTAKGSIKAGFYDAKLTIDGSRLVNKIIVNYLKGILKKESLEIPIDFKDGYVSLQNIPSYSGYLVKLYYGDVEVSEGTIDITRDEVEVSIKLRGVNLTVTTLDMYGHPISADVKVYLENGEEYFTFKTDNSGSAEVGELLPINYKLKAYLMSVECGELSVQPQSSTSYTMNLRVKNVYVKLYDKDRESAIPDALIELYTDKSKISGTTNSSGIVFFKNMPLTKYSYTVYMYGFKVGEGETEINLEDKLLEFTASGILDLRLSIVDGDKQPIESGKIVITVGDKDIEADVDDKGQARIMNLPNTTLYISGLYYKGVKVKTEPNEINLVKDEMTVPLSANIYTLQASIKLKNGEPMKFGEVNLYVNGEKTSKIDLSVNNPFTERLPGGELKIEVVFKNVRVASKTFAFDSSKELTMTAEVYLFTSTLYNTLGEKLRGVKVTIEGEKTPVEELETDENGVIETYLPSGTYRVKMSYGGSEYSSLILVNDTTNLNIMLPVDVLNPFFIILLSIFNAASISVYFIKKLKNKRIRQRKKKKEKVVRKVLRI